MREVDLHMVFADLGIDPHKNFFSLVEKNHVLIDNEITVLIVESNAGTYNGLRITIGLVSIVILLQLRNGFDLQFLNPNLLRVGLGLAEYDFGGAFDVFFLSFAIEFPLFL